MTIVAPADLGASPATTTAESALRLHDLSKRFKVRHGILATLRDPKGATWVKMLATLTSPDQGWATVYGADVMRDSREVRRLVAPVVADERGLHWRLSALENLRLFATLYALRGPTLQARVDEVLDVVVRPSAQW